jgi:hypothetical protein
MRWLGIAGLALVWATTGVWAEDPAGGAKGGNRPGASRPKGGKAGDGRREGPNPLQRIFQNADANNDGKVTLEELKTAMGRLPNAGPLSQNIDKIFQRLDANGDGALTAEEIKNAANLRPGRKPSNSNEPNKKPEGKGKKKPDSDKP